MRNLKRALSMALASVMVLGLMVVGASAAGYDSFTDKDTIVHKEAVSMITELGVLAGLPDGSFGPTQNIDRASFARLVCVVLNGGKEPVLGNIKTTFTDTQGNWAESYIAYCVDRGIIAGRGNGTFGPSDNVTGSEAAKMLLVALGYDAQNEGIGGATWQTTTDVLANQAGLYEDLETMNTSAPLTRDAAAQMIYNVLNAETVTYSYTYNPNGTSTVLNKTGKTLLEDKFGVTVVEGIVVANEYGSVIAKSTAASAKDEGKTQIEVTSDEGVSGTYSVSTGADLLGKSVTLYIDYKTAGSTSGATVVGNAVTSDDNKVYTSLNGDTVAAVADDNDLTMADGVLYFSNYAAVTAAPTAKDGGELTLIDNDDDGEVEYVLYNEYTYGPVTAKSTTDDGYLTVSGIGKFEDSSKIVGFDDVEKGDMVQAITFGGKLYVEKLTTVTGNLTAYSTSKATIKIDDTEYTMSELAINDASKADPEVESGIRAYLNPNKIDVAATFYLDSNNVVVAVGDADEANIQYAVLKAYENKATSGAGNLGTDAKVKMLLADGTTATYTVAKLNNQDPSSSNQFAASDVNGIFSYTLTSDNEIKLTRVAGAFNAGYNAYNGSETVTVTFDQSKPSFKVDYAITNSNDKTYTITNDTVFLYDDGDDITRYVGKNSAPDLKIDVNDTTAVNLTVGFKGTNTATLVYIQQKPDAAAKDGDFLYYYNDNQTVVTNGVQVTAVVNGVKQTIVMDNAPANKGLYAYTVDSDGVYSVEGNEITGSVANQGVLTGTVSAYGNDYVTVAGSDKIVTSDTLTVTVDEANGKVTEGTSIGDGDTVFVIYNNDDEVLYIIITNDADAGSGNSGSTTNKVDSIVLGDATNGKVTLTTTLKDNVASGQKAVITAQFQRSSDDGKTWVDTGAAKTATISASNKTDATISNNCTDGYLYRAVVTVQIQDASNSNVIETIADGYVTNMVEGVNA